ncbi:hypothetical protein NE237_017514 [Protea cynaroides]|uniref:Uncharacterized protein n=1 Tax=Protea cynaroides TaxID=273540 RepID=A0A9Q0QN09_9MAGN|nr:hypothetical protein NE237_017514 [Protea cynaroides]
MSEAVTTGNMVAVTLCAGDTVTHGYRSSSKVVLRFGSEQGRVQQKGMRTRLERSHVYLEGSSGGQSDPMMGKMGERQMNQQSPMLWIVAGEEEGKEEDFTAGAVSDENLINYVSVRAVICELVVVMSGISAVPPEQIDGDIDVIRVVLERICAAVLRTSVVSEVLI